MAGMKSIRLLRRLLRKRDKRFINISFYQVNPETRILVVYNNKETSIKGFDLKVKNRQGEIFYKRIPALQANEQYMLPLDNLKSKNDEIFSGNVKSVTAITSFDNEHFRLQGKEFHRS